MATATVITQVLNHELTLQARRAAAMAAVTRMTRDLNHERASQLAKEAVELADAGQAEVRANEQVHSRHILLIR